MDAQQLKFRNKKVTQSLVVRLVVAWLALVVGAGLWQGYGQWLLSGGARNVY